MEPALEREKMIEIAKSFTAALPHCAAMGIRFDNITDEHVQMSLSYQESLIGDTGTRVIHGGAISALLDSCCASAVAIHPKSSGMAATLDLRIDYMRPATPGQNIIAQATCYHRTRSIAFVRAVAMDDDVKRPVAMATGAFTV